MTTEEFNLVIKTILHLLNYAISFGMLIGVGMLLEYIYELYSVHALVALPITVIAIALVSIPVNYFEDKIEDL